VVEAHAGLFLSRDDKIPKVRLHAVDEPAKGEKAGLTRLSNVDAPGLPGPPICGEESAMIESIEGKRGLPRHRPPDGDAGRFVSAARRSAERRDALLGARLSKRRRGFSHTADMSAGAQLLGLRPAWRSGRQARPAGSRLRELIDEYGGRDGPGHAFKPI